MAHDPDDAPKGPVTEDPALDSLEARLAAARKAEDQRLAQDHAKYPESAPIRCPKTVFRGAAEAAVGV